MQSLKGEKVVVTGILNSFADRDALKHHVMSLGGQFTTAASGRTTILVTGTILENGLDVTESKKYKTIIEKNAEKKLTDRSPCKIMTEENFLQKFPKIDFNVNDEPNGLKTVPGQSFGYLSVGTNYSTENVEGEILSDKYRPKKQSDLIGNNALINDLRKFLVNWEKIHVKKISNKMQLIDRSKLKLNPLAKAVLLSGPPGIGKSSAALTLSKELGFETLEFNASDTRSRKLVQQKIGATIDNMSINLQSLSLKDKNKTQVNKKRVIIMDEVDGMSAQDRGGIGELVRLIKTSKFPIICICNDRMKGSVRTLANHCFDLRFRKPNKNTVIKRMSEILKKENIEIEPNALEAILSSSNGDIRQTFNVIQMKILSLRRNNQHNCKLTYSMVTQGMNKQKKDSVHSIDHSQATQFMFGEAKNDSLKSFKLRYDAFFVSYDLIPLLIAQHYLPAAISSTKQVSPLERLQVVALAAEAVSDADLLSSKIMQNQEWNLLPTNAAMNVRVASITKGFVPFPGFPEWLGRNSTRSRKRRLLHEFTIHLRPFSTVSSTLGVCSGILSLLKQTIVNLLTTRGKEGVSDALELMESYGLSRDDLFETMNEISLDREKPLDKLPAVVKREFTRLYNLTSHKSPLVSQDDSILGLKKKKIRKKSIDSNQEEESTQQDVEMEALISSMQKKKKTPTKRKSKTGSGTSKRRKT
eukprot:maker-scaffold_17-snap-gene-1.0-mRNA-1 protein AED:0.02 eAED:0.02 QI:0/0/0/0.66/1/1/3/0/697